MKNYCLVVFTQKSIYENEMNVRALTIAIFCHTKKKILKVISSFEIKKFLLWNKMFSHDFINESKRMNLNKTSKSLPILQSLCFEPKRLLRRENSIKS